MRAARKHLAELETHLRPAGAQADLFAAPPPPHRPRRTRCVEALAAIDPDALTPREAQEALYRLKARLDGED